MWAKRRAGKTALCFFAALAHAQQPPMHAESASTIDYSTAADGSETVEIRNEIHELSGTQIPGADARTVDNAGQYLFNTYVPLLSFSIFTRDGDHLIRRTGGAARRQGRRRRHADLCFGRPYSPPSASDLRRPGADPASAILCGHHANPLFRGRRVEAILQPELPIARKHSGAAHTRAPST
jgi:hypothetical protein